jgi:3-oxoacyl-[acyl-carrier-protein] synthase-3
MEKSMVRTRISGTGMYVPDRVVTNVDLEKLMDTNDEWIRQRTGIVERRYVSEGETPATLAERASRRALEGAGLAPGDVDCIVIATLSGEADFPGTSFFLQGALGLEDTPCFDLRAQCTGFLYALSVARSFVRAEQFRRVLVVGCEVHSTGLDFSTEGRDVTVIFGDGAGAVLVEPNTDAEDPREILSVRLHAQGRYARKLWTEAPGSAIYPQRHFLFHQANLRINEYVAGQLEVPPEKVHNNIQKYGNCSAASIPMLLAELEQEGRLHHGEIVALTGFGSGFSWGSAILRW